jgi:hypothetical protein
MKNVFSQLPKIILIIFLCLLIIPPFIALGYTLITQPVYSIKEPTEGEKYNLYCNEIMLGMTSEQVHGILLEKGEYREQIVRESSKYLEVMILYLNEEINERFGKIIIQYKNEIVEGIFAGAGWDVLLPYCNEIMEPTNIIGPNATN